MKEPPDSDASDTVLVESPCAGRKRERKGGRDRCTHKHTHRQENERKPLSDYSNTVAIIPSTLHPIVVFWTISGTVMLILLPQKSLVLSNSGMIPVIAEEYR